MVRGYSVIDRANGVRGSIKHTDKNVIIHLNTTDNNTTYSLVEYFKDLFLNNGFQTKSLFETGNLGMDSRESIYTHRGYKRKKEFDSNRKTTLSERQVRVLNYLKENGEAYQAKIERGIDADIGTLFMDLKKLKREGYIVDAGYRYGCHYYKAIEKKAVK
jgi:uncharacterized membrane protein